MKKILHEEDSEDSPEENDVYLDLDDSHQDFILKTRGLSLGTMS